MTEKNILLIGRSLHDVGWRSGSTGSIVVSDAKGSDAMNENRRKARAIAIAKANDASAKVMSVTVSLLAFFAVAAFVAFSLL
jgi:hypothetical protein